MHIMVIWRQHALQDFAKQHHLFTFREHLDVGDAGNSMSAIQKSVHYPDELKVAVDVDFLSTEACLGGDPLRHQSMEQLANPQ